MTIPDLPLSQAFALIYVRKGGSDSLFTKVSEAMRKAGVRFHMGDLDQLRALGYLVKPHGSHHVLTPNGLFKAGMLAKDLARQFNVHHVAYGSAAPGSSHGPTVRCSCGWNTFSTRTNEGMLRHYAAKHLEKVEAGTYKPIGDVVDNIVSKLVSDSCPAKQYSVSGFVAGLKNPGADARSVSASAPGDSSQRNLAG